MAAPADAHFILIDWGTTNLRAWLVDQSGHRVDSEQSESGLRSIVDRDFEAPLSKLVSDWVDQYSISAIVMAGMVGARTGWHEAPYVPCPTEFTLLNKHCMRFQYQGIATFIMPGVAKASDSAACDVMRGEETQAWGVDHLTGARSLTAIMPGTHSKWVRVEDRAILDFTTVMTGELFAVLAKHSLLGQLREPALDGIQDDAFLKGIARGAVTPLQEILFSTRADVLLGEMLPTAIDDYLSGLLIGAECAHRLNNTEMRDNKLVLIADDTIADRYGLALKNLNRDFTTVSATDASISGLYAAALSLTE
ncbi:MAG: 2-dehydro-3-deoxygalactonokinase [Pseudomonadota bacterium]